MPKKAIQNKYLNPNKINRSNTSKAKKYKCPRCKSATVDYGDSFECPKCHLEFDKKDFKEAKTEEDLQSIMSVEEKLKIIESFRNEGESDEEFQERLKRLT